MALKLVPGTPGAECPNVRSEGVRSALDAAADRG